MKITEMLHESTIDLTLQTTDKKSTLKQLVTLLDKAEKLEEPLGYLSAVLEREAHGSTGIGYGIAIPHAKTAAVKTPALAFGLHKEGVEFASLDDAPAHLIFMIAAPEGANNLHLQTLAKLSRKLIDEDFRETLRSCTTKEEVLNHLSTIDEEV